MASYSPDEATRLTVRLFNGGRLEALSRRPDQPNLDRESTDSTSTDSRADNLERLEANVGRR